MNEGLKFVIVLDVDSREEFYNLSSKAIADLITASEKSEKLQEILDNTKTYMLGTVNGLVVNSIWFVEIDSPVYKYLEGFPQKFDVFKGV